MSRCRGEMGANGKCAGHRKMAKQQGLLPFWLLHGAAIATIIMAVLSMTGILWGWPPYDYAFPMAFASYIMLAVVFMWYNRRGDMHHRDCSRQRPNDKRVWLHHWASLSGKALMVLFVVLLIRCIVGFIALPGLASPAGVPIFHPRPRYFVGRHDEKIPVSEREFRMIGTVTEVWRVLFQVLFLGIGVHRFHFGKLEPAPGGDRER